MDPPPLDHEPNGSPPILQTTSTQPVQTEINPSDAVLSTSGKITMKPEWKTNHIPLNTDNDGKDDLPLPAKVIKINPI